MKRAALLLLALTLLTTARADEGMWQPHQLPQLSKQLKALGLRMEPAKLTDLTEHPMNAVISLGGCTASFVSPEGLVITNHHCAYRSIQYNSTEDNNLLDTGLLAADRGAELFAGPGSRVLVTEEVTDVTDRVLGGLRKGVNGRERYQAIEEKEKELVAACEEEDGYRCRVSSFHGGLQYYLTRQLEIRDVRLVYAPAGSIGNFGGDIDNWMWPRHTGDYSFYRAYVNKDGQPADYSEDNVPYRPKHHLTVSPDGLTPGDYVMVVGYPGRTNRYRLAAEVENVIEWTYPVRKKLFDQWLEIIERETADRPDAAIKLAGRVAGLNNASKNYQGMMDGFAKSDVIERKEQQEQDLQDWIQRGGEQREPYRTALAELRDLVERQQSQRVRDMYYHFMARRSDLLGAARTLYRLSRERQKPDAEREPGYQERDDRRHQERMARMERTFDARVDRAAWRQFILNYAAIPVDQHVPDFDEWFGIQGNEVDEARLDAKLDEMYSRTELGDTEARARWLEADARDIESSSDPFLQMAVRLYDSDMAFEAEDKALTGLFQEVRPRYMTALIAYLDSLGKPVYPDANGTLRVTYGSVRGYVPADATVYTPFTTVNGILQKETGEEPFHSPPELLEGIRQQRFGRYVGEGLGTLPVNFLSTVDTTGGNSGSPTLNADAELVGLLFDGNYESINADWDFNREITRSIHVDIRYVLWIMDQVDDAHHLLREMGIQPSRQARR
jgi:hypothetical protein